MKRYFEIIIGFLVASFGLVIAAAAVWTVNALFGGTMSAVCLARFELTVNNAWFVVSPILVFAVALMLVGGSMALESNEEDS